VRHEADRRQATLQPQAQTLCGARPGLQGETGTPAHPRPWLACAQGVWPGTQLPPLSFFKRRAIFGPGPATSDGGAAEPGARLSAMLRSVSDGVHGAVLGDSSNDMSGLQRLQRLEPRCSRAACGGHGWYLSCGMGRRLHSRAMPCSRHQVDVARGASHAGRRWIWHPEQA
jgi:hypothetical protein